MPQVTYTGRGGGSDRQDTSILWNHSGIRCKGRLPRSINSMCLDSSVGKSAGTEKRTKTLYGFNTKSCYRVAIYDKPKKVSISQIKVLVDVSSSTRTACIILYCLKTCRGEILSTLPQRYFYKQVPTISIPLIK